MTSIKKITGVVTSYKDLSPTARDVTITLREPLIFEAGSFVNIFILHEGAVLRRAFSISASDTTTNSITVSVRLNPKGMVTPLFWADTIIGMVVSVMGPLGLNTADKMYSDRIFLFGYGIGAGVVKSLATHFAHTYPNKEIFIMTGNRSPQEILHRDYFDLLTKNHPRIQVKYVVSDTAIPSPYPTGYIQDHISNIDFSNADVYVCGQEIACQSLVATVRKSNPVNCTFFIEGFH